MRRTSLWAAALVALLTLALGFATGTAVANRQLGNNGGRLITGLDRRFTLRAPEGLNIICELVVEGVIQAGNIEKVRGNVSGRIVRTEVEECRNSTGVGLTFISALTPWPVFYESFSGTLPRITEVRLSWRIPFLLVINPGFVCLYEGTTPLNTSGTTEVRSFRIEALDTLEANSVPLFQIQSQELMRRCPRSLVVEGLFTGEVRTVIILL
jgi:hypothetical protein